MQSHVKDKATLDIRSTEHEHNTYNEYHPGSSGKSCISSNGCHYGYAEKLSLKRT